MRMPYPVPLPDLATVLAHFSLPLNMARACARPLQVMPGSAQRLRFFSAQD
jgi:hypothetical protein